MACGEVVTGGLGVAKFPPPSVWWSGPAGVPQPCDRSQVSPSSSVYEVVLQAPSSCDSNTRPLLLSAQRMGSSETRANGDRLSAQVTFAGETLSSKMARSV